MTKYERLKNRYTIKEDLTEVHVNLDGRAVGSFIIDTHDVDLIKSLRWSIYQGNNKHSYVYSFDEHGKHISLSNHLMKPGLNERVVRVDKSDLNYSRRNLVVKGFGNFKKFSKNNTSGRTGVILDTKDGEPESWRATITSKCRRFQKTFSINKYGNDEAFKLAVEQREKWEEEFGNRNQKTKDYNSGEYYK